MVEARDRLAAEGFWQELSGAAGIAALKERPLAADGPVVAILTSTGLKDVGADDLASAATDGEPEIAAAIRWAKEARR